MTDNPALPAFLTMPLPVRPGEFLRENLLPMPVIDVTVAAKRAGLSPAHLQRIGQGQAPFTAVTGFALGELAGNDPQAWMHAQAAYDMWQTRHLGKFGRRPQGI